MFTESVVKKNEYYDSVLQMRVAEEIRKMAGVIQAAVLMATENNKELLKGIGLLTEGVKKAGADDLIIAVQTIDAEAARKAVLRAEELLAKVMIERVEMPHKTLNSALKAMPDANLVLISVPGPFAAREAFRSLNNGLNVFLFSDNVSVEDELKLKLLARKKGLMMMGPDCGTSIINGVALAFANVVKRGTIGIVGASGTGIQEVSTLLDRNGMGLSHAIGTGGRDISERIGGIMMIEGIKALEKDERTEVIVLISKPPAPQVEKRILSLVKECKKPVVVDFVGRDVSVIRKSGGIPAVTLEDAAMKAVALQKGEEPRETVFTIGRDGLNRTVEAETRCLLEGQKYIRGLFSGGTFCAEATMILTSLVADVYSNTPLESKFKLKDTSISNGHTCLDMGAEVFTVGRPHPMIDPSLRQQRLIQEANDPETAVILLDLVLGYGAHLNPAGAFGPTIKEAKAMAKRKERYLSVVVSICGTDHDPQNFKKQESRLMKAGVVVMPSNAQAVRMAALIATRGKVWEKFVSDD